MRSSILDPTPKDAHDCRTAPSRTARAMSEWTEIKARFERPLGALAVCVMLLLFSSGLFDNAKKAYLPANPATLHAVTVRLDSAEYRELLAANGFEVLHHVEWDAACGNATVWLARRT